MRHVLVVDGVVKTLPTEYNGNPPEITDGEWLVYEECECPAGVQPYVIIENGIVTRFMPARAITYREQRIASYPPMGDQLDALWKLIKANADKIDLVEALPLFEAVQAVKDKYPKPPTNDIN